MYVSYVCKHACMSWIVYITSLRLKTICTIIIKTFVSKITGFVHGWDAFVWLLICLHPTYVLSVYIICLKAQKLMQEDNHV